MDTNAPHSRPVNNAIYSALGERWYEADDDPIALLRAESRLRNVWVNAELDARFSQPCDVLDIGCGAGFMTNELAQRGHRVTGLDASAESLAVAAARDVTGTVKYDHGTAYRLPYSDGSFACVGAMDLLEHVDQPRQVISEAARVLAPGGIFFFHTYNRNWLVWLIVIKGVEWFVKNTAKDIHVLRLCLRPDEVRQMCTDSGLAVEQLRGTRPCLNRAFLRLLTHGVVANDFRFTFTASTRLGYTGYAIKRSAQ